MSQEQENEENRSSELDRILSELAPDQIRFVVARQNASTVKEAAEALGLSANRVYQWKSRGVPIDEAVRLVALNGLDTALRVRKDNLAKAMMVKIAGLDLDDDRLRQSVATEIIEWELGKAEQKLKHGGEGEQGELVVRFLGNVSPDDV